VHDSDLALAPSQKVLDLLRRENSTSALLPSGADFEHFHATAESRPAYLSSLKKPIIGYCGTTGAWFNSELIEAVARVRRDWQFVLVGTIPETSLSRFRKLRNAHVLGEPTYASLPGYVQEFDACVMPFRQEPPTNMYLEALFAYLSAGKQVVVSELDETRPYAEFVHLADGLTAWLDALDAAVCKPPDEAETRTRLAFARANTWARRLRSLNRYIEPLFLAPSTTVTKNN
jgi:hypothetical protein